MGNSICRPPILEWAIPSRNPFPGHPILEWGILPTCVMKASSLRNGSFENIQMYDLGRYRNNYGGGTHHPTTGFRWFAPEFHHDGIFFFKEKKSRMEQDKFGAQKTGIFSFLEQQLHQLCF